MPLVRSQVFQLEIWRSLVGEMDHSSRRILVNCDDLSDCGKVSDPPYAWAMVGKPSAWRYWGDDLRHSWVLGRCGVGQLFWCGPKGTRL